MNTQTKALFYVLLALSYVIEGTTKLIKHGVALVITLAFIAGDLTEHLYNNRTEYLTKLNTIRNNVGSHFVLEPAL